MSESPEDRVAFWTDRYARNRLGWHKLQVNENLLNYYPRLCQKPHVDILLPLCGKSLDLKWLYEQGHNVVGIEGVEKAVLEFFKEQALFYVEETIPMLDGKLFRTPDGKLKIYMCDIMKMTPAVCGTFDSVWDRGALVAVYENDREPYASVMKSLLKDNFVYLLSAIEYESTDFTGPPRVITRGMIDTLYGDSCHIEFLQTNRGVHACAGPIEEKLYLLTPKM